MLVRDFIQELTERYWANHSLSLRDHYLLNQEYQPCSDVTRYSEAVVAALFDGSCSFSQAGYSNDVSDCKLYGKVKEVKFKPNIQPSKCLDCGAKASPFSKVCQSCGGKTKQMKDSPISLSQKQYWSNRPDSYVYGQTSWDSLDKPSEGLTGTIVWKMFQGDDPALKEEMTRLQKLKRVSSNTRQRALDTFDTSEVLTINITLKENTCIVNHLYSDNETLKHRLLESI